jgi:predicted nucleotidyltransferase
MILPALLAEVAAQLDPLELNYAFVGGSIVEFLVDHRGLSPVRPTDDLDIIVEVVTQRHYAEVERKLRAAGFEHDISPGAPICRWLYRGVIVDIMPTSGASMGLNTQWFAEALASVQLETINGVPLRLISPVAFIATKLAAFADRGRGDYYGSHDLEDIVAVIDGRARIVEELAEAETSLRAFVQEGVARLMGAADFQESLAGHLPFDEASQRRLPGLRKKLQAIAASLSKP